MKKKKNFKQGKTVKRKAKKGVKPDNFPKFGVNHDLLKSVNIDPDPSSNLGLVNLPIEYKKRLEASGLSKKDIIKNKDTVLSIIGFQLNEQVPNNEEIQKLMEKEIKTIKIENPRNKFSFDTKLGEGAFGDVYKVVDKDKDRVLACKEMKIKDSKDQVDYQNEFALHRLSEHPNIVKIYDAYIFDDMFYILLDFMEGGNLTVLCYGKAFWKESNIAYVLRETLKGLDFLHTKNIIHRDIKSDNILYDKKGRIKLADFGFTKALPNEPTGRSSIFGTIHWLAPEIFKRIPYSFKVDIWSLGIVALEFVTGEPPLFGIGQLDVMQVIRDNDAPTLPKGRNWSYEFHHFLPKCLRKKPEERKTANALLWHPFLEKACDSESFAKFASHTKEKKNRSFQLQSANDFDSAFNHVAQNNVTESAHLSFMGEGRPSMMSKNNTSNNQIFRI